MSVLEPRVSFSSNFASLFNVMRHNSSVLFQLIFICFGRKEPINVQILRLSSAYVKIHQIPIVIFQTKSQFFFKVWITLQCHERYCTFLFETLHSIDKSNTSKWKFSDFRLLAWKLTKFLISFFKPRVSFLLNLASHFSVITHNSS